MSNLRMRVFAGPNGSGKSTIIQAVRNHEEKGIPVDFGTYVNADDIAAALRKGLFNFSKPYKLKVANREFVISALSSGLIGSKFTDKDFKLSYSFYKNAIKLKRKHADERLAQIIADFLRKKLIAEKRKLSFETVFFAPF